MSALAVGYFDAPEQTTPAHDPGLDVDCPVCTLSLEPEAKPIQTISVCGDSRRSYFYRVHKSCYEGLTEREQAVFDAVAMRDQEARLIFLREYAHPGMPTWADATPEVKAACREEAE